MKRILPILIGAFAVLSANAQIIPNQYGYDKLSQYVDKFNDDDEELYINEYPNHKAKEFLAKNIPLFDCPDESINGTYYFRWWTFRKHIVKTEKGHVITEFLPKVRWSGEFNTIACPAGHHIREGRWLKDSQIIGDYVKFWSTAKHIRSYTFWYANSAYEYHLARPNEQMLKELYPTFKKNIQAWEKSNFSKTDKLFKQKDGADGMEISISGAMIMSWIGYRATINSYMFAEYETMAKIAQIIGNKDDVKFYTEKAQDLKARINSELWDKKDKFYKVMFPGNYGQLSDVRELHGYTPWYFNIPPEEYSVAWEQIKCKDGFKSKWGLTSAERRDPRFRLSYIGHECQWNGPVWPFSTSITLTALANFINNYKSDNVDKDDYFDALKTYADAHRRTTEDGRIVFWIDENQHPDTGDWISRTALRNWNGPKGWDYIERGKDYNHSTFNDLIITGLMGIRLGEGGKVAINPLAPDSWDYFAIENVPCKNKMLTILWDEDGTRYGKGKGFMIFANGKKIVQKDSVQKVEIDL